MSVGFVEDAVRLRSRRILWLLEPLVSLHIALAAISILLYGHVSVALNRLAFELPATINYRLGLREANPTGGYLAFFHASSRSH